MIIYFSAVKKLPNFENEKIHMIVYSRKVTGSEIKEIYRSEPQQYFPFAKIVYYFRWSENIVFSNFFRRGFQFIDNEWFRFFLCSTTNPKDEEPNGIGMAVFVLTLL
jgi:hypothetical protein